MLVPDGRGASNGSTPMIAVAFLMVMMGALISMWRRFIRCSTSFRRGWIFVGGDDSSAIARRGYAGYRDFPLPWEFCVAVVHTIFKIVRTVRHTIVR